MFIEIVIDEKDIRQMLASKLSERFNPQILESEIHIEVKTKANYKAEWEAGCFRAKLSKFIPEP